MLSAYLNFLKGFLNRATWMRLAALGLAMGLFYALDWRLARLGLRDALACLLTKLGHRTEVLAAAGQIGLRVDGHTFAISPKCTYFDLVLVLAPLCWGAGRKLARNLRGLSVLAAAVLLVNLARVTLALHLSARGASWYWCHDLPDSIIYWSAFGIAALLALGAGRLPGSGIYPASANGSMRQGSSQSCSQTRARLFI